jgi:hypothetical protein
VASLYDELKALVAALNRENVPYALCGGLAMGVWGVVRATEDIDLLVQRRDLERILSIAGRLGYTHRAKPMSFAEGSLEMHRVVKVLGEDEDPLSLDLLVVTPAWEEVWQDRESKEWQEGALWVVSRAGLIRLKSARASGIDLEDIRKLKEAGHEDG